MKLAAIINVWADSVDFLNHCAQNLSDCGVDGIIIVWSEKSNYGEIILNYLPIITFWHNGRTPNVHFFQREPQFRDPRNSETDKRNYGLDQARSLGYTHFISMDQDEFYDPECFKKQKERFKNEPYLQGIVCPCNVYFKYPTLTIGRDVTLVPFIHQLSNRVRHEFNKKYPYAFSGNEIKIDPTRQLNLTDGILYTEDIYMEHFSYVRRDIEMKIRNSTARNNIERSSLREDYTNAEPGYFCRYYQKTLMECQNKFNIPSGRQTPKVYVP